MSSSQFTAGAGVAITVGARPACTLAEICSLISSMEQRASHWCERSEHYRAALSCSFVAEHCVQCLLAGSGHRVIRDQGRVFLLASLAAFVSQVCSSAEEDRSTFASLSCAPTTRCEPEPPGCHTQADSASDDPVRCPITPIGFRGFYRDLELPQLLFLLLLLLS